MQTSAKVKETRIDPKEQIIIALDVKTISEAREIVAELGDTGAFKIGLQLFLAGGPRFVREMVDAGAKIFLDLKFHDIPNTVAKAAVEAARLGVWMFNVHAAGGSEMMRRTVADVSEVCEKESLQRPKIIAVTVLTSSNTDTLKDVGILKPIETLAVDLAKLAAECGLDGVVASPHEVSPIRQAVPANNFLIVTPGIRPLFATNDDQKRVMTPKEACEAGSDYLVIGRPITAASNRRAAFEKITKEIDPAY